MKLGRHTVGPDRTFIIAEAGTNYAADTEFERLCRVEDYITAAAGAGADAVKFQIFVAEDQLFCPVDGDDKRWTRWNRTLLNMRDWRGLKEEAEKHGLVFLASAFQQRAVDWLKGMNVEAYKVASRARDTYPYDSVPGPFIVSMQYAVGMLVDRVPDAVYTREHVGLHCVPEYPSPWAETSLWDGWSDGLSDHTGDIWAGLHAITGGASMLEVHFSIHDDKHDAGNDKAVCLTIDQLQLLCRARDAFASLRQD